jgi:uncharacterized protein
MKLDLRQFRGDTVHVARRYDPSALEIHDEDFRVVAPIAFEADVRKDANKVRIVGRVTTTLECSCSRCLEPFAVPVDAPFDLLFLPAVENTGDEEQEVAEDDIGVSYYRDDEIDIGDVMREQFFLALPMKPLCRDDCQGLCPMCGRNRNREACDCQSGWVDPRLAPLRKLLEGNDG